MARGSGLGTLFFAATTSPLLLGARWQQSTLSTSGSPSYILDSRYNSAHYFQRRPRERQSLCCSPEGRNRSSMLGRRCANGLPPRRHVGATCGGSRTRRWADAPVNDGSFVRRAAYGRSLNRLRRTVTGRRGPQGPRFFFGLNAPLLQAGARAILQASTARLRDGYFRPDKGGRAKIFLGSSLYGPEVNGALLRVFASSLTLCLRLLSFRVVGKIPCLNILRSAFEFVLRDRRNM
jgi:hypothetical protein